MATRFFSATHQNTATTAVGEVSHRAPSWWDLAAVLLVLGVIIILGSGARQMVAPFQITSAAPISLSPWVLPMYAVRTTLRMLAALAASLIFTLIYATLAAKSRRAEIVLIPILDVLQSVPILGYLSFTVIFFVSLFPGNILGPELAAIFAIFTSEAWNMTFSFYQSLSMVPADLDEASRSFRLSGWQRFWTLEVPFAMPGLVWNMMMSMSGAWFFVVASEAISVGKITYTLPGIGSYVSLAIQDRNLHAVGWAILAMTATIIAYDQLLFRPMVAWSDKFRSELTASAIMPKSWVLDLFRRASFMRVVGEPVGLGFRIALRSRLRPPLAIPVRRTPIISRRAGDYIWYAVVIAGAGWTAMKVIQMTAPELALSDVGTAFFDGLLTMIRVAVLIAIASAVWVPIGIMVGLRPRLTQLIQPLAQFLAAFPANLLFPIAVFFIVRYHLSSNIWLSPLMILGTQWYILFNVIAGASAFPTDFREAAGTFHIRGWRWWREVMLPGIFPYYVTGAITASGGAWNASVVSEAVSWGHTSLTATGLGAYIEEMTNAGDFPRIALGIAVMSLFVIVTNRLVWRPLYSIAESRVRLN
ncbi:MAG TPA: ABC transporter permease subunit [Candidatus Binataceae bacterium]|nr:ABC transporter permease subunit [Candidatus Binataceae bacterium]